MQETPRQVAVLGLGRLGAAVARRLVDAGWDVCGWTRSGHAVPGVRAAAGAAEAVSEAAYVVLVLFDGAACRDVLSSLAGDLSPGAVVVNLSTVGPDEVDELAAYVAGAGGTYVHAPVIGTVGPAREGRLTVLAGTEGPGPADPLLADLGTVLHCGDPARAAGAKLVANGVLADAVLATRHGLANGEQLGLSAEMTLDVLERTPLGGLVAAKRPRLTGPAEPAAPADFAVGALRKDVGLLAGAAAPGRALQGSLAALGGIADDADIVDLARPRPTPYDSLLAGTAAHPDDVLAPLLAYVRGHATGDPAHFREAFLPSAHVEGLRGGEYVSWPLDDYCRLFTGHPAEDEASRRRSLDVLSVTGSVGHAVVTLRHGSDTFTDQFLLVRVDTGWRIANKVYDVR